MGNSTAKNEIEIEVYNEVKEIITVDLFNESVETINIGENGCIKIIMGNVVIVTKSENATLDDLKQKIDIYKPLDFHGRNVDPHEKLSNLNGLRFMYKGHRFNYKFVSRRRDCCFICNNNNIDCKSDGSIRPYGIFNSQNSLLDFVNDFKNKKNVEEEQYLFYKSLFRVDSSIAIGLKYIYSMALYLMRIRAQEPKYIESFDFFSDRLLSTLITIEEATELMHDRIFIDWYEHAWKCSEHEYNYHIMLLGQIIPKLISPGNYTK